MILTNDCLQLNGWCGACVHTHTGKHTLTNPNKQPCIRIRTYTHLQVTLQGAREGNGPVPNALSQHLLILRDEHSGLRGAQRVVSRVVRQWSKGEGVLLRTDRPCTHLPTPNMQSDHEGGAERGVQPAGRAQGRTPVSADLMLPAAGQPCVCCR